MAKSVSAKWDGLLYTSRWRSLRWDTEQFIRCKGEKGIVQVQIQNKGGGVLMVDCYLEIQKQAPEDAIVKSESNFL